MKKYLLAVYRPDADDGVPPRDVLDKIMQDVRDIREDMKVSRVWIYSGGQDSPSTALRYDCAAATCSRLMGRLWNRKNISAALRSSRPPIWTWP